MKLRWSFVDAASKVFAALGVAMKQHPVLRCSGLPAALWSCDAAVADC